MLSQKNISLSLTTGVNIFSIVSAMTSQDALCEYSQIFEINLQKMIFYLTVQREVWPTISRVP